MYPAKDARELAILLRISRELDVVGDVTATVDNPSELLAWALILAHPQVLAWRATDSATATCKSAPTASGHPSEATSPPSSTENSTPTTGLPSN